MPNEMLKFDDLQPDVPQFDALVDDREALSTPKHQLLAGLEGMANTATAGGYGALATRADKALGLDPSFHLKVAEANPVSNTIGNVLGLGVGPVGEAIGAAGTATKAAVNGLAGNAAKLAVESALFQTTDELAKAAMADPSQSLQTAATNITLSGLLGGALGMGGGILGKGVAKAADSEAGKFVNDFRTRIQEHLLQAPVEQVSNPDYLKPFSPGFKEASMYMEQELPKAEMSFKELSSGQKAADSFMSSKLMGQGLGGSIGGAMGHSTGIPYMGSLGAIAGSKALGPALDAIIKPLMRGVVSGEGFEASSQFMNHVMKGDNNIANAAKAVFDRGLDVIPSKLVSTREDREHIKDALNMVQDAPESILNAGGLLHPYMPSHNVALGQLTGNAVQYLTSIRPVSSQKSPLDTAIPPSKDQEMMYNRALDIANQPLTVMQHIKDGTLLSHDLGTFMTIYPALHQKMAQQLTNSMIEHKSSGQVIPYKTRAGLSMFMNQPLDSTFTPQSIQAAQRVYLPKTPPTNSQKSSGSPDKLSKLSSQYQTAEQSREARKNK